MTKRSLTPRKAAAVDLDLDRRRLKDRGSGAEWSLRRVRRETTMYRDRFSILFHEGIGALASKRWSPCTWRCLMYLLKHLDFREWRHLPQAEIAADLAIGQAVVSKSVKLLIGDGLVERDVVRGKVVLRMSAVWGWRGSAKAWHAFMGQRAKEARMMGSPVNGDGISADDFQELNLTTTALLQGRPVDAQHLKRWLSFHREHAAMGRELSEQVRALLRKYADVPA